MIKLRIYKAEMRSSEKRMGKNCSINARDNVRGRLIEGRVPYDIRE